MRKILVSVFVCLISLNAWAQAPEKMSYQAVVRDNANALVVDKVVGIRISILRGSVSGTAAYVETQNPRSNTNGLVTLEIGAGTVVSGSFAGLNWSTGPYFIQTEIDPSGGSNYSILGVSQLVSVPYALYAKTSGSSTPGPAGPVGATGAQGPIGPAGAAGSNGAAGANGLQGDQGPQGPRGDQGAKGDTGAIGPQGPIGLTGPAGAIGPQGPQGATGATGPQGPIGLTGPAGAIGPQGAPGAIGPQGPIGLTGPAGANGINGVDGAAGVGGVTTAGTNITLSGSGTVASPYVVSANIPAAAAGTLTGSSLNATVTGSSLTSVGTLTNLTVTNPIVGSVTGSSGSTTGNAATATKLATPRNINDVAFDGSADITVRAAAGTLTGSTLNATVTGSSLTSVGTLTSATVNGKVIVGASSEASASAVLEANSTTQGFLPPRMTRDQRNAIFTPAAGLIVWCTNCGSSGELQVNNSTSWTNLIGGPASFAVPDAPTNPVATAGNAQASVTFTPPASNGGGTITGYTVTSSPDNRTATGAGSPLVVTGLTNLTSYTFTVVATNAAGNSVASAASTAVTIIGVVTNPSTGKIWMDRNLGATQVATSSTDAAAYGNLFQWGRGADGHQIRTSATTTTLSNSDQPENGNFILVPVSSSPFDWRSPQNTNLWQGVNGLNNPCPSGYRLPTDAELDAERNSWSSNNAAGALASPLKLPLAGYRNFIDGSVASLGGAGYYWSSTVNGNDSRSLSFTSSSAILTNFDRRAYGNSVRCIKN